MPEPAATPLNKERPLWPLALLLAAFLIGWLASVFLADEYLGNFSWAILATLGVMGAYWVIGIWTFVVPIRKAEKQGTAVKADKEAYRFADSLYLLGFLFTLSSFATASHFIVADKRMCDPFAKMSAEEKAEIYKLPEAEQKKFVDDFIANLAPEQRVKCVDKNLTTDKLVQNSVALVTTILGLILRILMLRLLPGKQEDMAQGLSNPAAAVTEFTNTVDKLREAATKMAQNGDDMSATLQRVSQASEEFKDKLLSLQGQVAYDFTNGADAIHRRLAALVQQIERLSGEAQDRIRQASMDQRQIHMETMEQRRQQEFELHKMTKDWLDSCLKVLNDSFTTLTEEVKKAGAPFNAQISVMLGKIHEELRDYAKRLNEGQIAVDQDRQQRMDAFAKAIEKRLCDLVKNLDAEGTKSVDGIARLVDNLIVQIAVRIGNALQELEEARHKLHEQQMRLAALAQDGHRP